MTVRDRLTERTEADASVLRYRRTGTFGVGYLIPTYRDFVSVLVCCMIPTYRDFVSVSVCCMIPAYQTLV